MAERSSGRRPPSKSSAYRITKREITRQLRLDWADAMVSDPNVTHVQYRSAGIISKFIDGETGEAFVTQETIAKRIGASKRYVWDALQGLEEHGYVITGRLPRQPYKRRTKDGTEIDVRSAGGRGVANTYRPAIDGKPLTPELVRRKLEARYEVSEETSHNSPVNLAPSRDPSIFPPTEEFQGAPADSSACAVPTGDITPSEPVALLRRIMGTDKYAAWFGDAEWALEEDTVVITTTKFKKEYIVSNFEQVVVRSWQQYHPGVRYTRYRFRPK